MTSMTSPAANIRETFGECQHYEVQIAFLRFEGMHASRQTKQNFVNILLPFMEDEGHTWENCSSYGVLLEACDSLPKNAKEYISSRGGIWSSRDKIVTMRQVLQSIDDWHA